jgi:monoamine oxidase
MEKLVMLLPRDLGSSFTSRIYYDEARHVRLAFANQAADMGKPIMHVYVHTDYVESFVRLDQKARLDIVVSALRQMVGDPSLTPIEIFQSDWTNSPWTRGSFGMINVHQSPDAFHQLSMPEAGGRVLFAGEATDDVRFAYVDGAVGSGIREARRLLSA